MVKVTDVPADSAVHAMRPQADYWDAYEIACPDDLPTALEAYLTFTARTPAWIAKLMAVRNAAVRLVGLKDVGALERVPPASAAGTLGPGDRVGIFTIRSVRDEEVVLEIVDSHLDVVVSIYRHGDSPARLTTSTLVFYHNAVGRLYMLPVAPMHRIVVRSIMGNVAAAR
jgi:hypothetical protein